MSVLRFPEWQKPCKVALLESDPQKFFKQVIVAEAAIFHRLHDMANSPENMELDAMADMLKTLRCLVANIFMLPGGEERDPTQPLQIPNDRLKPNRANSQTQAL